DVPCREVFFARRARSERRERKMKPPKPGSHIHLMGICGTAMASLAGLLKERGYKITGSDQNVYPPMSTFLQAQGIQIMEGYKKENLHPKPDFVVVGNVISKHFEEAQELVRLEIPYASLPETMGESVIEDRHSIVVAGTHGKTTTTSMAAWICEQEKLKPGFLVGGIPKNFNVSFQNPKGSHFVIEGDEYDTAYFAKVPKFLFYKPRSVILTSIEFDHADIYNSLDDILKAFQSLLEIIPQEEGLLIYNSEDVNIPKILPTFSGKKVSYGKAGDWQAENLEFLHKGLEFDVLFHGKKEDRLFLPMFGQYNVGNALAVYALARELSFSHDLKESFSQFQGVKRRQELIGEPNGIQVIEDFAHHPTAVASTIESFKKRETSGRLFAVFEPRSNTSRRKIFQEAYQEALRPANFVLLSEPFQGTQKVNREDSLNAQELIGNLDKGQQALCFQNVEEAIELIKDQARPGDTVLIMSNGGFQGIYQKLLDMLS
ncbi:MAG: UDP-N-acetylmuramate:L-alanyl-gamma-D-glutamyl-meso-diaminopimelate ligase, partial [Pseudomonadota bacterium]